MNSKEEYYNLCKSNIILPENPEEIFGKTFLGWFDYLGIEMQDYYYKIYEFREKINQYVKKNNIYGCQFHPERSSKVGATILENFMKIKE